MKRPLARSGWTALTVMVAWWAVVPAQAQTGEPIRVVTDAVEVAINGRVQTQFNTTTVDGTPDSELIMRRARIELGVRVNDLVSGRLSPEFAGDRVQLRDVYLQLDFSPGLQLRTGKFYRPFSLLENTSSTRILPIERGIAIRGLRAWDEYALVHDLAYSDRDVGIQVMGSPAGAPLGFSYAAGVFQGPEHYVGDRASYQYVARSTIQPIDGVRFGAAWSNRAFSRSAAEPARDFDIERGNAFEADVEVGSFAPGFHLLGEVAAGDFNPFADQGFVGAQAWLAYRTRPMGRVSAVEPTFRVSYGDVDEIATVSQGQGGTLLTPGLNLHLGGRNRVMFNYDLWLAEGVADNQSSFKAMFQLAF